MIEVSCEVWQIIFVKILECEEFQHMSSKDLYQYYSLFMMFITLSVYSVF